MPDSVSPAEGEPNSGVSSGWLRAARCCALICAITLGVEFLVEAYAHGSKLALITVGAWGSLSLPLLYLLLRRGKNSLAFALGLGAGGAAFFALFAAGILLSLVLRLTGLKFFPWFSHVMLFVFMIIITPSPTFGPFLLLPFDISLGMLGVTSIAAFKKMEREAKGMGRLPLAFRAGICCGLVVWPILLLLRALFFGGGFRI
jgi:hypothetical protein